MKRPSRLLLTDAFKQKSRMPWNQAGKRGLRVVVTDSDREEDAMMPSAKSMALLDLINGKSGS